MWQQVSKLLLDAVGADGHCDETTLAEAAREATQKEVLRFVHACLRKIVHRKTASQDLGFLLSLVTVGRCYYCVDGVLVITDSVRRVVLSDVVSRIVTYNGPHDLRMGPDHPICELAVALLKADPWLSSTGGQARLEQESLAQFSCKHGLWHLLGTLLSTGVNANYITMQDGHSLTGRLKEMMDLYRNRSVADIEICKMLAQRREQLDQCMRQCEPLRVLGPDLMREIIDYYVHDWRARPAKKRK